LGYWLVAGQGPRAEQGQGGSLCPESLMGEPVMVQESEGRWEARGNGGSLNEQVRRRIPQAHTGHQSDETSRQGSRGCCQATVDYQDVSGHGNRCQDAGDTGDANTTLLTSRRNTGPSDAEFIFADVSKSD